MTDPFLEAVARDLQLSNTHASIDEIKAVLALSKMWRYEWGVIFAIGNDMHIHILSNYRKRVFLRKPLREVAFFMFSKYPVITTSVLKTKPDAYEFDLRMGWKLKDETNREWMLEMRKEDFVYGEN